MSTNGWWRRRPLLAALASVIAVLGLTLPVAAQSVTEFTIPTPGADPLGITAGPDGALWFVEFATNKIGRVTTTGDFREFAIPTANSSPTSIAVGADGALWFSELNGSKIGRITTDGAFKEFAIPTANSAPEYVTPGPDGALYFTENNGKAIGRQSPSDVAPSEFPIATGPGTSLLGITTGPDAALWFADEGLGRIGRLTPADAGLNEASIPTSTGGPHEITAGPDGALWFTESASSKIGRIPTGGMIQFAPITEFATPTTNSSPRGITTGPDGAVWFTEVGPDKVGRISTAGPSGNITIKEFSLAPGSSPRSITTGPDGALWFTESGTNKIGRLSPPPSTSPLFASTLPASRSVQVGHPATAFASILNTGPAAANCGIAPVTTVPGTFLFQATDPHTNALTGSPDTAVPIAAGASQSFLVAFTPGQLPDNALVPTNAVLGFHCDNVEAAGTIVGVNTLLLTFGANPVPDLIAVGLTPSNDGFAHTGGPAGTGLFAISSSNVGAGATLTARARLSNAGLPLTALVCETDPATAVCKAAPAPSVSRNIGQSQTATWAAFIAAGGAVAADPAHNRVFFEFVDAAGIVRGSTSTAVTTQ